MIPRTLYGRLALSLLVVVAVLAVAYGWVGARVTDLYDLETRQKLYHDLAANLIAEGLIDEDGSVDPAGLEHAIHLLMVVNPAIEVYVLDADGRVEAYATPPGRLHRPSVDLEPIRRFLSGDARLPIRGDDPRAAAGRKVFSAAPIGNPDAPTGYVYVVLGGQLFDTVADRLAGSYAARMGAWAAAGAVLFALAAGLILFAFVTRRLRTITRLVEGYDAGARPPTGIRNDGGTGASMDEIDRLGDTFARMADRIQDQVGRLEDADRVRRELVANVSHDLRTPLASLHGYLETLLLKGDRLDPEERRRYLEIAARHGARLSERVDDLFELAKLDADAVRPSRERFSPSELVQDVLQKFEIDAARRNIRLEHRRDDPPPFVDADIGMMERVLENLIGNALRHTPDGGRVTVVVDRAGPGLRVTVRDTGKGIPEDELPSVFERFYRCRAEDRSDEGAGLGLAIARRIVELHEGTIDVRSRIGEGTAFSFVVPAPAAG